MQHLIISDMSYDDCLLNEKMLVVPHAVQLVLLLYRTSR